MYDIIIISLIRTHDQNRCLRTYNRATCGLHCVIGKTEALLFVIRRIPHPMIEKPKF